jgi:hypothetical protein
MKIVCPFVKLIRPSLYGLLPSPIYLEIGYASGTEDSLDFFHRYRAEVGRHQKIHKIVYIRKSIVLQ